MIVAACSESMLQRLTTRVQQSEASGQRRPFADVPEPWAGFREQAHAALDKVFVARPERRRVSGEVHAATIRQVRERDGVDVVYERKAVDALTLKDLARVKDGEGRNAPTVTILRAWIEAGKPGSAPPRSPKGDAIRKVRLETGDPVRVSIRGGTADRGDMARVDVFVEQQPGKRTRYHLVPIYPHQIVDFALTSPPNRAVVAYKEDENDWIATDGFKFVFSLYINSLVKTCRNDGTPLVGYFKGLHRGTAAISLASPLSQQTVRGGIGTKTLALFQKLTADRLGRVSHVPQEVRTWRGEVCT